MTAFTYLESTLTEDGHLDGETESVSAVLCDRAILRVKRKIEKTSKTRMMYGAETWSA